MKRRIYFYNPLTRLCLCEQAKPLRERIKRLRVFSRALFASFSSASRNSPAMRRRASALPAAFRSHPRESAMKPRTYFYNSLTRHRPTKILPSPRDRLFASRTSLPSPRASDEARNLFLQSANASSHPPAPLRTRPIIETTRRHRLRGLSRAIAKRRPWRKIAGNRPARGFQNFSIECSIFVHKKAKMGGYTVSIETKGGNGL